MTVQPRSRLLPVAGLAAVLLTACGGGGSGGDNPPAEAGPCVHSFLEPVFTITAAAGTDGTPVPTLRLTSITLDGQPLALGVLDGSARNATVSDGGIDCTVACGFATREGVYAFIASAPGHQPVPVQVTARYAVFQAGCPSSSSGGTALRITLPPL